ncbi:aryl-alcohol dehydrogenase-like predicted oxidoreductase [Jejuia pallidilutea]|uniref:Aryl-alcohol dehydrogenase-like predicted oxidoreductase n=1 Tax=Jejuia pallidilutea TaxID=504487 RepID=A0A362X7T1_9FLAO|nr:aldo/keto reductase [Jejuia pallidilutea]PQV51503.1 aryl-alcohol dehydrogenase-like predicted oxidoreductase [Jejuia pallidilutea]
MKPTYNNTPNRNLVLGTVSLGGAWGKIDEEESIDTILYGLKNGISRIDTAPAYANAEKIVGKALRKLSNKNVFVSTKVGKLQGMADESDLTNYNLKVMEDSVHNSMEALGQKQLDLLFLHEPENVPPQQIQEVVRFLNELKKQGKAKQIGFGGMPTKAYWSYLEKGVFDVAMGYNNLDACSFTGLETDIPLCKKNNMLIYQASVLHMGLLGNRFSKYYEDTPEWISKQALDNAAKVLQISKRENIPLPTLAHRFVLGVKEIDWIVLGARNLTQLKDTLNDIAQGPLSKKIFTDIINSHYASIQ